MFVAVTLGDRAPLASVGAWAADAWPDHRVVDAHGWRVWSDGREGQQPHVTRNGVVVADGVIWDGDRPWGPAAAADLGQELRDGWPLAEGWDGSFALAALDGRSATLAVEPAGLRRLRWAVGRGVVAVGSLQAPCALAIGAEPDVVGVASTLTLGQVFGRRTLARGCSEVMPGECVRVHGDGRVERLGFEPAVSRSPRHEGCSPDQAAEEMDPLLRSAVARAFDGYSPVSLALSSGVDSRLALGAALPDHRPVVAISYGDPSERDVTLPLRLARAVDIPHTTVDLRGHLFAPEAAARADARRCEATWHPAWLAMNEAISEIGCKAVLMGDVTDSLQVRGEALWGRRARLVRQVRRITTPWAPEPLPEHYRSVETWWDHVRGVLVDRALRRVAAYEIEVGRDELVAQLLADLDDTWDLMRLGDQTTALEAEDALQLVAARQQAGSQVNAVGGGAVGHSAFGTRHVVRAARGLGLDVRKDRRLLRALSLRLLPREIRAVPTATIPLVPVTSPVVVQNAVWAGRYGADLVLRRANRVLRGRLPRERVAKSLELPAEYRSGGGSFLAGEWARSGAFVARPLAEEYRSMASGVKVPMVPISQYTAVRVDEVVLRTSSQAG